MSPGVPLKMLPEQLRYVSRIPIDLSSATKQNYQYILPAGSVVYTGCVGDDELAEQLKAANKREGLDEVYLVKKGEKTGACGVIITGHHRYACSLYFYVLILMYDLFRSLVTTLRVAEKFDRSHLSSPQVAPLIEAAKVFYVEGYFLTHGTDSVLELSQKAAAAGKVSIFLPSMQPR